MVIDLTGISFKPPRQNFFKFLPPLRRRGIFCPSVLMVVKDIQSLFIL